MLLELTMSDATRYTSFGELYKKGINDVLELIKKG